MVSDRLVCSRGLLLFHISQGALVIDGHDLHELLEIFIKTVQDGLRARTFRKLDMPVQKTTDQFYIVVLFHVIDGSHPDWEEQVRVVDRVLADLSLDDTMVSHVFNKMDNVADPEVFAARVSTQYERAVCVSAARRDVDELKDMFAGLFAERRMVLRARA